MAGVKSIIDVDVNDDAFKRFHGLFEKYQAALAKTPADWAKVNKAVAEQRTGYEAIIAAMLAQGDLLKKRNKLDEDNSHTIHRIDLSWRNIAANAKRATTTILKDLGTLLRWSGAGTIFAGLLGAGGLFGLDRLAGTVGAGRRASLGLGIGYGARQAFATNYGRVVDPEGFLSGVNEALHDVTRRYTLYAAGLGEGQLKGDTGQVSAALLDRLKDLADKTPSSQLAQIMQARGLGQFISLQDFERLKATPRSELNEYAANYARDARGFALAQETQKRWQDFSVQLDRAGQKIENTFVRGLEPLTPALTQLSNAFSDVVGTLLKAAKDKHWIEDFAAGIKSAASYIASDKFQNDMKTFADSVATLAGKIGWLVSHLPGLPTAEAAAGAYIGGRVAGVPGAVAGGVLGYMSGTLDRAAPGGGAGGYGTQQDLNRARVLSEINRTFGGGRNNPGNLRKWADMPRPGGYAAFPTYSAGVEALEKQLQIYATRDHLNTIAQIITKWAPPGENDTAAYIRDVAKRTGFGATQRLDLSDAGVLAKLVAAIAKHENKSSKLTPNTVITIMNNTGGNTIVSAGQLAQ